MEAIDRFHFGWWDSYQYSNYKIKAEAEAKAEAVEAALKSTASTSLILSHIIRQVRMNGISVALMQSFSLSFK